MTIRELLRAWIDCESCYASAEEQAESCGNGSMWFFGHAVAPSVHEILQDRHVLRRSANPVCGTAQMKEWLARMILKLIEAAARFKAKMDGLTR